MDNNYTPEQTKALAIAAGWEGAYIDKGSVYYPYPTKYSKHKNPFYPTNSDTCLLLMDRYELTVQPCMYERILKGSCCGKKYTATNMFADDDEFQEGIADTIPEAVANCVLKILEAEQ